MVGSILKGENSLQGAIRETKEEVGVNLDTSKGKIVFSKVRKTIDGKKFNDIMDVWLFEYSGEVELKNATSDEVRDVRWLKKEEIKELFENNKLVQTLNYFFEDINI